MKRILIFVMAICGLSLITKGQSPTPFACTGSDGFGYYSSSASSTLS